MKITIGGIEVFSRKYEVWDDLLEEYVDYETEHERQVPDYDFNVMVEAIVRFFLELSTTVLITEAIGWKRRRIQGISLGVGLGALTASVTLRGTSDHLTAWSRALCNTTCIF
jgi:hypothetical protein